MGEEMIQKPVPPFTVGVHDPIDNRDYFVYAHKNISFDEAKSCVAKFRASRRRKMSKNAFNLPSTVVLELTKADRVKAVGLPTQGELNERERVERRQKNAFEKFRKQKRKSKKSAQ